MRERILAGRDDQVPDGVNWLPPKTATTAQRSSGLLVGREGSVTDSPGQQAGAETQD